MSFANKPVNTELPSSEIEQVWQTNNNQREISANTQVVTEHHITYDNIEIIETIKGN